ncbi:hypothetical protein BKA62DRAFT_759754 [Auriculariales sp. MPI-PUGE-AT-0066]|nr:hypothetical protein BKA62DRAFT_759754 [Auriculariales sp. MPI-PUGE-AT-0066]
MERELRNFKVNWDWSRISLLDSNPGDYSSHRCRVESQNNSDGGQLRAGTFVGGDDGYKRDGRRIYCGSGGIAEESRLVVDQGLSDALYTQSPAESLPGCQHTNRDIESLHQPKRASHTQREEKRWKGRRKQNERVSLLSRHPHHRQPFFLSHSPLPVCVGGPGVWLPIRPRTRGFGTHSGSGIAAPSTRGDVESAHAWDPLCPSVIANQRSRRALSAASRRSFPIPRN